MPLRRRDRLQVGESGLEPPRHLRVAAGGEPDLVERESNVSVPVEHALDQPQLVVLVADVTAREWAVGDLAQAAVQAVDDLDGRCRVVRRGSERALGDIDELAESVRGVVAVRALVVERDQLPYALAVEPRAPSPWTRTSGEPRVTKSPIIGTSSSVQPARRASATSALRSQ